MGFLDFIKTREKLLQEENLRLDADIRFLNSQKSVLEKRHEKEILQTKIERLRNGHFDNPHKERAAPNRKTTSRTSNTDS